MVTWMTDGLLVVAGVAIGATSIGGVLVVPVLSGIAGIPLADAVAASSLAFLPTGLLGWRAARDHAQAGGTPWTLHAAALLGAIFGALLVQGIPAGAARIWLAALAATSGLYGLASTASAAQRERPLPGPAALSLLGLAVGLGSAMSGTGGPVLLLPLLMLMGASTPPSVAAALAVQLPVAFAASATHLIAGDLPLGLGLQTGAMLMAGAWAGRVLARRLPIRILRACASLCLIGVAAWYGVCCR